MVAVMDVGSRPLLLLLLLGGGVFRRTYVEIRAHTLRAVAEGLEKRSLASRRHLTGWLVTETFWRGCGARCGRRLRQGVRVGWEAKVERR